MRSGVHAASIVLQKDHINPGSVTLKRQSRWMGPIQARLDRATLAAYESRPGQRLLEVGCAEGELTEMIAGASPDCDVVGFDLPSEELTALWDEIELPNLTFLTGTATDMPFEDDEFDVVFAIEVLEHVPDWRAALDEITRVCSRRVVASVPREPIWRLLNMARLKWLSDLGNTPGHVNHWSRGDFRRLMEERLTVREVRSVFPWTLVVADVRTRLADSGPDLDTLMRDGR
jgi:SAM-dependent methyltransferase